MFGKYNWYSGACQQSPLAGGLLLFNESPVCADSCFLPELLKRLLRAISSHFEAGLN
jgi:hypothetical protein